MTTEGFKTEYSNNKEEAMTTFLTWKSHKIISTAFSQLQESFQLIQVLGEGN